MNQKIIEPVPFADWAAPIVPVLKSDKKSIRICGDFKQTVNRVVTLEQDRRFICPAVWRCIFSKVDLSQAYQLLELDEKSKQYTVVSFNRLPFGISSSPGIFQLTSHGQSARWNTSCHSIPDDILIAGTSKADHLKNLDLVLQRLQSAGLSLKREKCWFEVDSVSYLGYKIDAEGLHPLPKLLLRLLLQSLLPN